MRKPALLFVVFLIFLFIVYTTGCRRAGHWLARKDVPEHADAYVVLMGIFTERVLQAYDAWETGLADRFIIVEESMGPLRRLEERGVTILSNSKQAISSLVEMGVPADSIMLLPGDSRSTLDEAIAVNKFLNTTWSADSLVLVSSPAHMRRAFLIFRKTMEYGGNSMYIGTMPSTYSSFNPDKWWRRKEDIQSVVSEYVKIGSFMFFEKRKLKEIAR